MTIGSFEASCIVPLLTDGSTKDLAKACGVSEPVLYEHFADKNELYFALLEDACHDHQDLLLPRREDAALPRQHEAVDGDDDGAHQQR